MKCPKCQYLGFETGDRCRNCGYDFSLLEFRSSGDRDGAALSAPPAGNPESWDRFASDVSSAPTADARLHDTKTPDQSHEPALPLFALTAEDQPLVRLPVTPRRPLAVRRAAENPRVRNTPNGGALNEFESPAEVEPELDFPEESTIARAPEAPLLASARVSEAPVARVPSPTALMQASSPQRRCVAAGIDYALLFGIDTAIVYFTVRMAGLDMSDWRLLPVVPLALFLGVIALAYVGVFTAIGGQTIGKMATRIQVVSDHALEGHTMPVGPVDALKRTVAVLLSWLTGGLGFLPALIGDHRALHDRLSRTRVVDLA